MTRLENYEAEAAVLGSVLLDGTLMKSLVLEEAHFHDRHHKLIFRAMKQAEEQDEFIDMVVVTAHLEKAIYQVGGTQYLLDLAGSVATTANLGHHEELVFQAYRLRKTREAAIRYSEVPDLEKLDELISSLQVYREAGSIHESKTIYDYLLEITAEITDPQPEQASYMTSFVQLDDMTGGLQRGELMIVAARPSVGKTAFALNLAAAHCHNGGTSHIFSLEMGTKSLLKRIISREGMIDGQKWRSLAFSAVDYERIMMAIGEISKWELAVSDKKRTVKDIRSTIRKYVMDDPDGNHLVVIDYLQLILAERRERRDLEVGEITGN